MAEQLAEVGIASAIWPLTRIVATPGPVAITPGTTGLVFTSQNAVNRFAGANPERGLCAWCVGARTAAAARAAGFRQVTSAGGTVNDLADLLAGLAPQRLLYLRAAHVSADLPALLDGSGHRIDSQAVYSAEPSGPPPPAIAAKLNAGTIGVIAIWSRRAAAILAEHLADNPDWPVAHMRAIAISKRAAEPLRDCGFARQTLAAEPENTAMITAICAAVRQ